MAGSLTIQRMSVTGTVPAHPELAGRCRSVIDRLDERRLVLALTRAFHAFDVDDPRQIVMRRLDISLDGVDANDPDRIAAHLADGIATLVGRIGAASAQGDEVVVFDSPADRLALYVKSRALGQAANAWWFSDFLPLALMSQSTAIRAALTRDVGEGLDALALLADADRKRVLARLSGVDAGVLVQALRTMPPRLLEAETWDALARVPTIPPELARDAATIYVFATLAGLLSPGRPDAGILPILDLVALAWRAREPEQVAKAIATGDAASIAALLADASRQSLTGLVQLPPPVRESIAGTVARGRAGTAAEVWTGYTPFGGLLLLYPDLPGFAGASLSDSAGDPGGVAALLALSSLWGAQGAAFALGDPILRRAFGVDPHAGMDSLADWLRHSRLGREPRAEDSFNDAALPPPLARRRGSKALVAAGHAAVAQFTRKLPGFSGSSLAYLRANLLDIGAQVTLGEDTVQAVLERPPLDVLFGISGLADRSATLPDGRTLVLERAR